jgi:hypothetical protein
MSKPDRFIQITRELTAAMNEYISKRNKATGEMPLDIALDVGRAMVMGGCVFIGKSLEIVDPDTVLEPGRKCLALFEDLQ